MPSGTLSASAPHLLRDTAAAWVAHADPRICWRGRERETGRLRRRSDPSFLYPEALSSFLKYFPSHLWREGSEVLRVTAASGRCSV